MSYVSQNFSPGQKLRASQMKHIEAGISTADANATKALDIAQKDHATLPPEIAGKADNWMIEEETGLAYLTSGGKKISSGIMIPNDGSGVGGSGSAGTPYAVQYVFQKLTDEQKEQARKNIGVGDGGLCYVLELSADEADAQKNTDAITAAISEHKYVALKTGDYPVKPGIVIESGKLDMNGSRFYTVDYKSETPLVYLRGKAPEICNGELEGSYDLADNEAGYTFFEKECLIRPEGVDDAYIHHMDLHNNWGYCISPGENVERVHIENAPRFTTGTNDIRFKTENIAIPEGYRYITAAGGVGYNYIISVLPVTYEFYNANGAKILETYETPRKRIFIPNGAAAVAITTRLDDDAFVPYYLYFTNYTETLMVSDCKFHHFHSLGMANMPGPTTVTRCSFIAGAKPRDDVYGTYRATTGGIDIEDVQTPEFIMSDCYSYDCAKLLMFGGYKGVVTNCIGDEVDVARGWQFDISNSNLKTFYTSGKHCRVSTNGVHADVVNINAEDRNYVRGDISTNYLSKGSIKTYLDCFDRFFVRIENTTNDQNGEVSGWLNGRIEVVGVNGLKVKSFSSNPGSRIKFYTKLVPTNNGNYYGALKITGDVYGLVSNTPFFPNGFTIHDSTFNIDNQMSAYAFADETYSGSFKDCVFNLAGATYFRLFGRSATNAVALVFDGCTINNADYKLFNFVPAAGSKVTFKNCTIANESNLFNGDTSGITINILSDNLSE